MTVVADKTTIHIIVIKPLERVVTGITFVQLCFENLDIDSIELQFGLFILLTAELTYFSLTSNQLSLGRVSLGVCHEVDQFRCQSTNNLRAPRFDGIQQACRLKYAAPRTWQLADKTHVMFTYTNKQQRRFQRRHVISIQSNNRAPERRPESSWHRFGMFGTANSKH